MGEKDSNGRIRKTRRARAAYVAMATGRLGIQLLLESSLFLSVPSMANPKFDGLLAALKKFSVDDLEGAEKEATSILIKNPLDQVSRWLCFDRLG